MIRLRACSRLHFGVLSLDEAVEGSALRFFGGVGMMVREPGLVLTVRPAFTWSAEGPLASRALRYAEQFVQSFPNPTIHPHHLVIEQAAPEHKGLGTGTQLGLAVARALAMSAGLNEMPVEELARRVGRGRRSALGIHGFAHGGFLVEAGKRSSEAIAPLVARLDVPDGWRVVLVLPGGVGLHGPEEIEAFRQLRQADVRLPTDVLCRLVLLGMLPALAAGDCTAFGEALYEFNRHVGEAFSVVQKGIYATPRLDKMTKLFRSWGVQGVAQSSWGPALSAVVPDTKQAERVVAELRLHFDLAESEIVITAACNQGAFVLD